MIKELICPYCGKEQKHKNQLAQHKRFCVNNPNREKSVGNKGRNKGNMPKHTKKYYTDFIRYNGNTLDITREQFEKYREEHKRCEICGKTIEESINWDSKFAAKHLCLDHNNQTNQFRGMLCLRCNRQLGWYERNKEQIEKYISKNLIEQNKSI